MTVGGTQTPPRVNTGDRDAVLRQIRWCAAVQTLVNCYSKLIENPVGNVEPMQLINATHRFSVVGDDSHVQHSF